MNPADTAYMRGFADALALAERAGTAILAGTWGHAVRREHAAEALRAFASEAREALGSGVAASGASTPEAVILGAIFTKAMPEARNAARAQGYSGDACDICGSLSMKRSGSCLVCEACGTTSGCS